jgi:hypothetical protein
MAELDLEGFRSAVGLTGSFENRMDQMEGKPTLPTKEEKSPVPMNTFRSAVGLGMIPMGKVQEGLQSPAIKETKEGNLVMRVLDFLNRPQAALVRAAEEATFKESPTAEGMLKGMKRGITGDKRSWIDYMDRLIPGRHPWVEGPIGFAGDVLLDPINLVPLAWPLKVARLLKIPQALKYGMEVSKAGKVLDYLAETKAVDTLGKVFKPGWELRKIPGAYESWRDLQLRLQYIRRNINTELKENWDEFRKVAKHLGQDPEKAAGELIKLREAGHPELVAPEYKSFYDDVVNGLEKLKDEEIQWGVLKPERVIRNYFPHILETGKVVEEGGELITKSHKGFATKLAFRNLPFFSKPRNFRTVEDLTGAILDWRKSNVATDLAPVNNWFRGYAIRKFVGESAVAWREFIHQTVNVFGKPLRQAVDENLGMPLESFIDRLMNAHIAGTSTNLPDITERFLKLTKGQVLVTPATNLKSPAMKGLFLKEVKRALQNGEETGNISNLFQGLFRSTGGKGVVELSLDDISKIKGENVFLMPSELAHTIKNTFKIFASDEGTKGLLGAYDWGLHWWKSMATSMRVPFHARNAISNAWLMYQAGVKGPMLGKRIADAALVQMGKKGWQGFDSKELLDLADRYGVRAYGWVGADVPRLFQQEMFLSTARSPLARKLGVGMNPWNPVETASRLGQNVGTLVEDNARLAVMLNQMKKTGITKELLMREPLIFERKIQEASLHVKKHLFDYTELTDAERNVLKRVIPFYTWLRKNTPRQLEGLFTHPEQFARLGDVKEDLFPDSQLSPTDQAIIPPWMKEAGFRQMPEKWPYFNPTEWKDDKGNRIFYYLDLPTEELWRLTKLKNWMNTLTPAFALAEIAVNVRHWPQPGKLAEPGQRAKAPFWANFLPEKLQKLIDYGPTLDKVQGKLVPGMNPQWLYGLKTAFPFLTDWDKAYPNVGSFGTNEGSVDKWSALSYLTGIRFQPLDRSKETLNLFYRQLEVKKGLTRATRWQGGFQGLKPEEIEKKAQGIVKQLLGED